MEEFISLLNLLKVYPNHTYLDKDILFISEIDIFKNLLLEEIAKFVEKQYVSKTSTGENITVFFLFGLNESVTTLSQNCDKINITGINKIKGKVRINNKTSEEMKEYLLKICLENLEVFYKIGEKIEILFKLTSYFKLEDKILVFHY